MPYLERHVIDGFDDPEPGEQLGVQPLDIEHRLGVVAGADQRRVVGLACFACY